MRKTAVTLLFSIAGALLNIACCKLFTSVFDLPLFMDTLFTITVTLTFGLFWGVFCGGLTNIIFHSLFYWGWEGYLFALCNIATALIVWCFLKLFPRELNLNNADQKIPPFYLHRAGKIRIVIDKTMVLIIITAALCLAMSILGGTIASCILSFSSNIDASIISCSFRGTMFDKDFPLLLSEIFSRIPVNIIDRSISVFLGYGIAHLMLSLFKFSSQRPKPSSSTLPSGSM